jgi:hypothetical protein
VQNWSFENVKLKVCDLMYEKEIDFKEYLMTVVICPDCGRHSALKLNWYFVAARKGTEILIVCLNCALLRINELKRVKDASEDSSFKESIKPVDVVFLMSAEDIKKF